MDQDYCSSVLDSQWEGMRTRRANTLARSDTKEGGRDLPPKPIIFTRYPNSQVGHGLVMVRPNISPTFDCAGELAMIIGRRCRHVKKQDWQSVVAGYSCYDNGSIREWQRHSAQFIPGKNFFKSGGFGPGS